MCRPSGRWPRWVCCFWDTSRRNDHLKHVGLEVLFVVALLTLPVYVSGVAGYYEIRDRPDVSVDAMKLHQDVALFGFSWMMSCRLRRVDRLVDVETSRPPGTRARPGGDAAAGGVACCDGPRRESWRRDSPSGDPAPPAPPRSAGDPDRFVTSAITQVAVYSRWVWPAAETVHFLGSLPLVRRAPGHQPAASRLPEPVPFADVHRLLPWGMLGFGANLITGMFFFVGQPGQYIGEQCRSTGRSSS